MTEEFKDPVAPQPVKPLSWSQVWIQATTRPSLETYHRLLRDPGASPNRAYLWIFASYFVGFLIYTLLSLAFPSPFAFGDYADITPTAVFGSTIIQLACCLPIGAVLGVIGVIISAALTQLVARILGGDGSYEKLVYLFGAIMAPLSIVSYVLAPIPFVNCLAVLLGLYSVALLVIAVNAVNNFGYGRAILAYFAIPLLLTIIAICGIVFMTLLIAPEIDAIFNDIISTLEATPAF